MTEAIRTAQGFAKILQSHPTLPHPGRGQTLQRWQVLATVAAQDLSVCKLAEAHWDALAILEDLGFHPSLPRGHLWAVWAADNPKAPLHLVQHGGQAYLEGSKSWCSGADVVTHALLTCTGQGNRNYLCILDLTACGIDQDDSSWQPVGMRSVHTAQLHFSQTSVQVLGSRSLYLQRPGFWHGGAGIAACWYGAACAIAQKLRHHLAADNPHAAAHLGAMFAQLRAVRAMLQGLAACIDQHPDQPWAAEVLALRSMMRNVATAVIEHSARAMGPAPLCTDAAHARRCADLAVWVTQQHAERDDENLGRLSQVADIVWEL